MKLYRINLPEHIAYAGTKSEAHTIAKDIGKPLWGDVTIEEIELRTDKDGVIGALNGMPVYSVMTTWGLTKLGALKTEEVTP